MQRFLLITSLILTSAAYADTKLTCEGQADGLKIQYQSHSYRPCVGYCIGSPDPAAILTTTKADPLESNTFQVKTSAGDRMRIIGNVGPASTVKITQISEVVGDAMSSSGMGESLRKENVYFQKKQWVTVEILSTLVPGGVVRLDCEQIKEASNPKEI